jgi:glycosyltransferase involved in cell wall biosynthesis
LITDWRCGNRDFARLVNSSRVVLTLPRRFSAAGDAQAHGSTPPPRLFETALAGGFQIAISPDEEIERYYDTKAEILTCVDDADAIPAIRSALNDVQSRVLMAKRARARTRGEHLYEHRVAAILKLAAGRETSRLRPVRQDRKVLLFVTHNRLGRLPGGGVELYQEMLARDLSEYEVVFLFPTALGGRRFLCVEGKNFSHEIETETMRTDLLEHSAIEHIFQNVLVNYNVDVVHFHHLLYLTLSLPKIARAYGIPTIWHVHDYYLICDRYNLITIDRRFCDVVNRGEGQCDNCLLTLNGHAPGAKARRNALVASAVSSIDAFIASTPFSGDYLARFFPEIPPGRIHTIELPSSSPERQSGLPETQRSRDAIRTLRVAIPGNFTTIKGGDYLLDVIRLCGDYDIEFEVLGRVEDRLKEGLASIGPARVRIRDGYKAGEIVALLGDSDLSLHLSIWPETYMLA